jgi:hypothetical protein
VSGYVNRSASQQDVTNDIFHVKYDPIEETSTLSLRSARIEMVGIATAMSCCLTLGAGEGGEWRTLRQPCKFGQVIYPSTARENKWMM